MPTILAVDDSTSMRQVVIMTLNKAGFNVIEAADGIDALDKIKTNKIDLVLTDVNMPNMDGVSLTKTLRALPNFKFTPILMLTTQSGHMKKEGKNAGATGWIIKPFIPEQLVSVINKLLG